MMDTEIREIRKLPGNEKTLDKLAELVRMKQLVPFLGAGFSTPACPTWGAFLETVFKELEKENRFASDDEITAYKNLERKENRGSGKFEHLASSSTFGRM